MTEELVSVVITTYKRKPDILIRAVNSVINQTYHFIEIIVVDDSPDSFEERKIIKSRLENEYPNIIYIEHKITLGACEARNTGLSVAKGKYIAYLDDDDEWLDSKIEKQVNKIQQDDFAMVYCGRYELFEDTSTMRLSNQIHPEGYIYNALIIENFIGSTSFPLIKTDCLRAIGGFDSCMKSAQDADVWLRIAQKEKIGYVFEPLAIYHWHKGDQITKNFDNKISGLTRLIEKNIGYLSENKKAYSIRLLALVPYYFGRKDIVKALHYWKLGVMNFPFNIKYNIKILLKGFKFLCTNNV